MSMVTSKQEEIEFFTNELLDSVFGKVFHQKIDIYKVAEKLCFKIDLLDKVYYDVELSVEMKSSNFNHSLLVIKSYQENTKRYLIAYGIARFISDDYYDSSLTNLRKKVPVPPNRDDLLISTVAGAILLPKEAVLKSGSFTIGREIDITLLLCAAHISKKFDVTADVAFNRLTNLGISSGCEFV